jgi:hypothetical protein
MLGEKLIYILGSVVLYSGFYCVLILSAQHCNASVIGDANNFYNRRESTISIFILLEQFLSASEDRNTFGFLCNNSTQSSENLAYCFNIYAVMFWALWFVRVKHTFFLFKHG